MSSTGKRLRNRAAVGMLTAAVTLSGCGSTTRTNDPSRANDPAPVIACLRNMPEARTHQVGIDQSFPGSGPIKASRRVVVVTFRAGPGNDNDFVVLDIAPSHADAERIARIYPRRLAERVEVRGSTVLVWMTDVTPAKQRLLAACTVAPRT